MYPMLRVRNGRRDSGAHLIHLRSAWKGYSQKFSDEEGCVSRILSAPTMLVGLMS
jgi:hypothetical protein